MQKSIFWVIVAALVVIILISPLGHMFSMNGYDSRAGWMMGPGHFMGGPMFLFPIIMLIVVLVVIYRIFFSTEIPVAGQNHRSDGVVRSAPESALDILKKRYARGEISQTEYEQMKKDLQD